MDGYHDTASILAQIRRSDIVLLPYLSREQVVSGVLVEAIASGKPTVATAFPHAVELLAEGPASSFRTRMPTRWPKRCGRC